MTLLTKIRQFLYNLATKATIKKESEICFQYDAYSWERYHRDSKGRKSKSDYSKLQRSLKNNQKRRDYKIKQKTAKWNWLKP